MPPPPWVARCRASLTSLLVREFFPRISPKLPLLPQAGDIRGSDGFIQLQPGEGVENRRGKIWGAGGIKGSRNEHLVRPLSLCLTHSQLIGQTPLGLSSASDEVGKSSAACSSLSCSEPPVGLGRREVTVHRVEVPKSASSAPLKKNPWRKHRRVS